MRGLFAAVDVHYPAAGGARAAMVVAEDLAFGAIVAERVVTLDQVAEYRPGLFYERELPAILAVLSGQQELALVLVDGYVHLDPGGRAGLGRGAFPSAGRLAPCGCPLSQGRHVEFAAPERARPSWCGAPCGRTGAVPGRCARDRTW